MLNKGQLGGGEEFRVRDLGSRGSGILGFRGLGFVVSWFRV